jgi:hypothetical protein
MAGNCGEGKSQKWFRGLDSNQDSRLQRPMCYQLHHPGTVWTTLLVYLRGGGWQNRDFTGAFAFFAAPFAKICLAPPCGWNRFLLKLKGCGPVRRGGRAV